MSVVVKSSERSPGSTRSAPRHAVPQSRGPLGVYTVALLLMAALVPLHKWWAVQILLVPLLLTLPGVFLLRALRVPGCAVTRFPIYIPCASMVVLFGVGLAVDIAGPLVGVRTPLRTGPLLGGLLVTCLGLLAASVNVRAEVNVRWRVFSLSAWQTWPLILPLAAAAGALRLNHGHGDAVALAALSLNAVTLVAAVLFSSRFGTKLLMVILYSAALSVMWAFSLRSHFVYGFDISTEYYDLHQAVVSGIWHTAHPGDAYGALPSVTVMPAELHFLSGVSDLLVFKALYPAICAVFPVAIFGVARKVLTRRWAFVAAAFIVMQSSFAQEIPGIARQEIALVFFAALIMAILDTGIGRRTHWALVVLLSFGLVLSHYSTTYVAILLIGLPVPLQWGLSWFREIPRITGSMALAFVTALAGAVIWYGPVTHSGSGLGNFAQAVEAQGLDVLPNRTPEGSSFVGGLLGSYLQGSTQTPLSAAKYAQAARLYYQFRITPLPDAGQRKYALQSSTVRTPPVKWHAGVSGLSLGLLVVQQLANVLGALGAIFMVLRRRVPLITRQVGLLGLATLMFLVVIRLSSTLAVAYNQERALVQALAVLAITLCWSLQAFAGLRARRQIGVLGASAVSLAVLFFTTSGLMGTVLGGGTAVNLANSGEDFERFYMTSAELASARWLGAAVRPRQLVYADRYAQLRLYATTGITRGLIIGDITPFTINQHAWVYASQSNVLDRRARVLFNNHLVTYAFPIGYLNANYDLVFTDGTSEVFHR